MTVQLALISTSYFACSVISIAWFWLPAFIAAGTKPKQRQDGLIQDRPVILTGLLQINNIYQIIYYYYQSTIKWLIRTPGLSQSFGNKSSFTATAPPVPREVSVIHVQICVLQFSPKITLKIKTQTFQYLKISFSTIQN